MTEPETRATRSTDRGPAARLSKSRVTKGLQCEKALWLSAHRKDLAAPVTPEQQARFDEGTRVGELAQRHFGEGRVIDAPYWDPTAALASTRAAIDDGAMLLFEAAFEHQGVLVRVDVLRRAAAGDPWELLEVKSSTSCKPQHLPDVAIQLWVVRGAGQPVDRCGLVHLDKSCVYPRLEGLFATEDVTEAVEALQDEQGPLVDRLTRVLAREEAPDVDIGPHCGKPYDCDFTEHCWSVRGVPEVSVFDVRGLGTERRWGCYRAGLTSIEALHEAWRAGRLSLAETPALSLDCLVTGRVHIDRAALADGLASWRGPLLSLDFETAGDAIPRLDGTRPYQQVPFQFSAHLRPERGADPEHHEYLHTDASDPRPAVAAALDHLACHTFGEELDCSGVVVAYNAGFERRCLEGLADACPAHATALLELARRLVDPLPVLRRAVYHPGFGASYSLKAVAPALLGEAAGYGALEVGDGGAAQLAFAELIAQGCDEGRRRELIAGLKTYCAQDTEVLLRVVEWMEGEVES